MLFMSRSETGRLLVRLAFLGFLLSGSAEGESIYIAQTSRGTDDGTSPANAHAAAWFNAAGNWGSAAGKIGPGDTLHLCGVFSFPATRNGLLVNGSGTSDSPIFIKFESGAILQSPVFINGNSQGDGAIATNANSWIVIDGGATAQGLPNGIIQDTDNGTGLGHQQWSIGIGAGNCSNCEIKNLIIRNIYLRTSYNDTTDMDGDVGMAISGSNWRVDHCVLHDIRWALSHGYNAGDSNNTVDHNEFYNNDHDFTLASNTTGTASREYVHDNYFHDYANWDSPNNMFHHDGIHSWNSAELSGASTWGSFTGLYVYNNRFDGDCGGNFNEHVFLEGGYNNTGRTPWTQNFSGPNAFIYGNLFRCTDNPPRTHTLFTITGPGVVFNNTLIGNDPAAGAGLFNVGGAGLGGVSGLPAAQSKGLDVRNNLLSGENTLIGGSASDSWTHLPDNDFYGYYAGSYNAFWGFGVDVSNFATWQSACNCDANSSADPGPLSVVDANGMPVAGSWLIGHGQNMFDAGYILPGMGVDINGRARPASGAWDVGAYQYAANQVRSSKGNAAPRQRLAFSNPITVTLLFKYMQAKKDLRVYDVAGHRVTKQSFADEGIYLIQEHAGAALQRVTAVR